MTGVGREVGLLEYLRRLLQRAEQGDTDALAQLERWTRSAERWTARAADPSSRPGWVRFLTDGST